MNKRAQLVGVVVIGVLAAGTFVQGLMKCSRGAEPPAASEATLSQAETVRTEANMKSRVIARTRFEDWGRNPFAEEEQAESAPGVDLALSGIAWDPVRPQAVINGRIVGVGDKVGGVSIVEINQDRVIVEDESSSYELHLWQKK